MALEKTILNYVSNENWNAVADLPLSESDVNYLTWVDLNRVFFELNLSPFGDTLSSQYDFNMQYGFINGKAGDFKLTLTGSSNQITSVKEKLNQTLDRLQKPANYELDEEDIYDAKLSYMQDHAADTLIEKIKLYHN